MSSTTKTIRVIRSSTIERTEIVELAISRQDGVYKTHERIAEDFVTAAIAAGQSLSWELISDEIKGYPSPNISAEERTPEPAPSAEGDAA